MLIKIQDPAIIVVNKPPGMPVQVSCQNVYSDVFSNFWTSGCWFLSSADAYVGQGGIGIKQSLDELAASCLSYDYSEPPRLVSLLVKLI